MNPQILDALRNLIMQSMQGRMPQNTFSFAPRGGEIDGGWGGRFTPGMQDSAPAPQAPQEQSWFRLTNNTANPIMAQPISAPAPQPPAAEYYGPESGRAQYFANMGLNPDGQRAQDAPAPQVPQYYPQSGGAGMPQQPKPPFAQDQPFGFSRRGMNPATSMRRSMPQFQVPQAPTSGDSAGMFAPKPNFSFAAPGVRR